MAFLKKKKCFMLSLVRMCKEFGMEVGSLKLCFGNNPLTMFQIMNHCLVV